MAFFDIFKKKQDTPPTGEQAQKQQEELSAGLEKTKTGLFSKLARAVAGRSTIDAGVLDDLEEVLISSDVGVETTVKIIRRIEERVARAKYMNASELLLVLDGSTGQNAFEQARQFTQATQVTSLTITKLDGTAKGGVVIGISDQFHIPVRYIGIGEGIDQLRIFDRKEFVNALFGHEKN